MSSVNPYSSPPGGQPASKTSGLAIASLVCGLLSFMTCLFTGIPAVVLGIIALLKISSSGGRLKGQGLAITGLVTGGLGTLASVALVAWFIPVLNAAREKGRDLVSMNQMRTIGLAMLADELNHRHFGDNIIGKDGRPLLSWRVRILPALGHDALYQKFHLDEPWDIPHNLVLAAQMPHEFEMLGDINSDKTPYVVPVGEGTIFEEMLPGKQKPGQRNLTTSTDAVSRADGVGNTIMLVETTPDRAVIWTKPEDLEYRRDDPGAGLNHRARDILVGYADGTVRHLSENVQPDTLRKLFSLDGRRFHEAPLTEAEQNP